MSSGILKKSPSLIQLHVTDAFSNFTEHLNKSDRLWFKGILKTTNQLFGAETIAATASNSAKHDVPLDNHVPHIEVTAIGCINCADKELEPVVTLNDELQKANARLKDLRRGVKYLLNVLFNPVVTFK